MPPPKGADEELARALRSVRDSLGRSQEAVAHEAGISVNSLRRIEYGQSNPTWTTVRGITTALGLTIEELGRALSTDE